MDKLNYLFFFDNYCCDLSFTAGISTETLIRSISKLKKGGIVDLEGCNIKILDIDALKLIE